MLQRLLWQEYGIPADLSYADVGRAVRLHAAEAERRKNTQ